MFNKKIKITLKKSIAVLMTVTMIGTGMIREHPKVCVNLQTDVR